MKSKFNYPVTKIIKVIDGDSIRVEIDRGFRDYSIRDVRLLDIDAPERNTTAGKMVRDVVTWWASNLQPQDYLVLHSFELDKYGRILGDITPAGSSLLPAFLTDYLRGCKLVRDYAGGSRAIWSEQELSGVCKRAAVILNAAAEQQRAENGLL